MSLTLAKWTLDEYHRMVELGVLAERRVELLCGEIVEMPAEGAEHATLNGNGKDYLRDLLGSWAIVREAKPITLVGLDSEPEPDLAVVQPRSSGYLDRHPYPEDVFLLVEFAKTTLEKDLGAKRSLYAGVEILEYWVVNLRDRELIVLREPVEGDYRSEVRVRSGVMNLLGFPEVAVSVQRLLAG